ncbi:hypothetical protein NL480_28945, partial [Klebsiella pneumoniae]|nr:hypothetical protein [Klebsiella pneumoniae]
RIFFFFCFEYAAVPEQENKLNPHQQKKPTNKHTNEKKREPQKQPQKNLSPPPERGGPDDFKNKRAPCPPPPRSGKHLGAR